MRVFASRRKRVIGVLSVLAVAAVLELYARRIDGFVVRPLALSQDTRTVVLIFHGSKDGDDPLLDEIAAAWPTAANASARAAVINYNWSDGADHRVRAAANGRYLGDVLGGELAQLTALESVVLVAHSDGAAVPDALCSAYRQAASKPARIEMIFLDPFGIRGFFDWGFGARAYGECADFELAYLNTDDPAPATNSALHRAFNIDITRVPPPESFARNGHYWPLEYFAARLRAGDLPRRDHAVNPRGDRVIASVE